MKMKTIFMLAFAVGTTLSHAGDLHADLNKREMNNHKRTGNNVTIGHRTYNALIGQFNRAWPFGQESNQDSD